MILNMRRVRDFRGDVKNIESFDTSAALNAGFGPFDRRKEYPILRRCSLRQAQYKQARLRRNDSIGRESFIFRCDWWAVAPMRQTRVVSRGEAGLNMRKMGV